MNPSLKSKCFELATSFGLTNIYEMGQGRPLVVFHGGPGLNAKYLFEHLVPLSSIRKLITFDQLGCSNFSWSRDVFYGRCRAFSWSFLKSKGLGPAPLSTGMAGKAFRLRSNLKRRSEHWKGTNGRGQKFYPPPPADV